MNKLKNIFTVPPSESLYQAILARIDKEKIQQAKRTFAFFIVASAVSFGASMLALTYTISAFASSEFPQYSSLLFSDASVVLAYWKQFLFLLAESLPILSISILLTTLLLTLFFIKSLIKNFSKVSPRAFA